MALLTSEERRTVNAKVSALIAKLTAIAVKVSKSSGKKLKVPTTTYTGFDALTPKRQAAIKKCLDQNKRWEARHGVVCFTSRPSLKEIPVGPTNTVEERKAWVAAFGFQVSKGTNLKRIQVDEMVAHRKFLVLKAVDPNLTDNDSDAEEGDTTVVETHVSKVVKTRVSKVAKTSV